MPPRCADLQLICCITTLCSGSGSFEVHAIKTTGALRNCEPLIYMTDMTREGREGTLVSHLTASENNHRVLSDTAPLLPPQAPDERKMKTKMNRSYGTK